MKRARDILLAVVLLGGAGVGAYEIGHLVDRYSKKTASQDSELSTTTTAATHHARTIAGHHITTLLVASAVAAVLLAILALGLLNAFVKSRKRAHWRAAR